MRQTKKELLNNLEERIDEYFAVCDSVNAEKKKTVKPYTLSGLMSYTGLSRGELQGLLKSKKYGRAVADAYSKIECFIEEKSLTGELSCNASMNSLKYNFGWGEKATEEDRTDSVKNINITLTGAAEEFSA